MPTEREQKLVDLCFELAIVAAQHMHGRDKDTIAEWVRKQLTGSGFPTRPVGSSHGILLNIKSDPESPWKIELVEPDRTD